MTNHRFQVTSLHPDTSICTHRLTSRGRAAEAGSGCAGRQSFNATCSCETWLKAGTVRAELKYLHHVHKLASDRRARLAELRVQMAGFAPANDALLIGLVVNLADVLAHDHAGQDPDVHCLNLTTAMGEQMGSVLRRLLEVEAESERLRERLDTALGRTAQLLEESVVAPQTRHDVEKDTGIAAGESASPLLGRRGPAPSTEQPAPTFFQPGCNYERGLWRFACLAVAPTTWSGERQAVGYLSRVDGTGVASSLGQHDWDTKGWTQTHAMTGEGAIEDRAQAGDSAS